MKISLGDNIRNSNNSQTYMSAAQNEALLEQIWSLKGQMENGNVKWKFNSTQNAKKQTNKQKKRVTHVHSA